MRNNPAIKTFISAAALLFAMLFLTGLLTYFIPNGEFNLETKVFTEYETRGISPVQWIFAPVLVLFSDSGTLVIAIIAFLLIISGAIYVLKETGLVEGVILSISRRFSDNGFVLMAAISFLFMSLGAFVGVFEEVVPLVPMVILLARNMGWDDLTGLGISVLACGLGFAAAVTNPFTIGIAQQLAGLPVFSGALLRVFAFLTTYAVLLVFLYIRIRRNKGQQNQSQLNENREDRPVPKQAYRFFLSLMAVMLVVVASTPFIAILRDLSLPLIGLIFLIAGLGVGRIASGEFRWVFRQFWNGIKEMSPAILLILLATGIKHVMVNGHILDTILYYVSKNIGTFSPLTAIFLIFLLVTVMDFFIGSGSAKAFILLPILMPIMDLLGVGRQLGILAFQFGDGFSNILFPTNAVLLISLGLSKVGYGTWLKFLLPLQIALFLISFLWLAIGYYIGYGL